MGADREPVVAVSGLGSIGYQHVQAFTRLGRVRIVGFDPDGELRNRAGRLAQTVDEFERLFDFKPDAVVVATPDELHLDQALAASQRGIATLVEKPVGASCSAVAAALPALRATGSALGVGYVLRHRQVMRKTRELLRAGVIGTPVSCQVMLGAYGTINAAKSRFAAAQRDRLYRDYSHEWDYLRWFFGPITSALTVARTVTDVAHVEQPNAVDTVLRFGGTPLVAAVHLDYLEPMGTRTVHVVGTGGSLFLDVGADELAVRADGDERHYRYGESAADGLLAQAEHVLAVALKGEPPCVGLTDGLAALAVAECVRDAAVESRWIDIRPLDVEGQRNEL